MCLKRLKMAAFGSSEPYLFRLMGMSSAIFVKANEHILTRESTDSDIQATSTKPYIYK